MDRKRLISQDWGIGVKSGIKRDEHNNKRWLRRRLADLMEQHKEELATLESLDSGAVYTLALKTHVGMSIETWRYFAGWCDKIQGSTVPISHARPNRNLTITRREPIGVCGLVTPWNYPLMMLSWKMAACLAAGNTVVMKPAQTSPLTALKFAELSAKAGIPPGMYLRHRHGLPYFPVLPYPRLSLSLSLSLSRALGDQSRRRLEVRRIAKAVLHCNVEGKRRQNNYSRAQRTFRCMRAIITIIIKIQ
jgi:hypothetical protein